MAAPSDEPAALDEPAPEIVVGDAHGEGHHHGAKAGAMGVHLGLREIEWIFALDRTRRDVVANRVAHHFTAGIHEQHQLWLWDIPARIAPDANRATGSDYAAGCCLQEDLGTIRIVNPVIHIALGRLLHPSVARPQVGHARCPHFLGVNWGSQGH